MSSQSREPLAPKTNSSAATGKGKEKGKEKATSHKSKTDSPPLKPAPRPKEHAPRSLDRLFAVDTSRALNVTLPSRYDPYYRFQDKPPVYAPYNSDILEEMARCGATSYSLALSEDSRCWRLNELIRDGELMKQFMAKPKGWTVRLGPRGEEVEYNVEDIVAAHLGLQPDHSRTSDEHETPNPCDTPRPSTPYCARERDFLRATLSWGGMYDDLEEREEAAARAKAKAARSRSTSAASSSSSTKSLDTAVSAKGKKEPKVVWKTAYEDALSMEELGRQLDEQAAEAQEVSDSESDEEEDGYGGSLFKRQAIASDDEDDNEDENNETENSRNAVYRAWNDPASDEGEGPVDKLNALFRRGDEEDSDDEISESDIEPDPESPQDLFPSCGDETSDEEDSEDEREEQGDEQDDDFGKTNDKKEDEKEVVIANAKEKEKDTLSPAPYVRPTAKSFLGMFFVRAPIPPADQSTTSEVEEQESPKPTLAEQSLSLSIPIEVDESCSASDSEDGDTPGTSMEQVEFFDKDSDDEDRKDDGPAVRPTGRGTYDVMDRTRGRPLPSSDTDLYKINNAVDTDEEGEQTTLSQNAREDYVSAVVDDQDKDEDEEEEEQDEETEDSEEVIKGGRDDNDDDDDGGDMGQTDQHNAHDPDGDHDLHHPSDTEDDRHDTRDHSGGRDASHEGTQNSQSGPEPEIYGPDWDIHLSDEYKPANPNGNYIARLGYVNPTADWDMWRHDELPDEWTEATEWYQGGPEPDPSRVEWCCPLSRVSRYPLFVTRYTEPTEYQHYTQEEADATFCNGTTDYEGHARWLEKKLIELERWRNRDRKYDLMINWRVRTGQQIPICGGWWFMWGDSEWWAQDWDRRWGRRHID